MKCQSIFGGKIRKYFKLPSAETFTSLQADSTDNKLVIFFLITQKIGFDISCKLSPIGMKWLNLFSGNVNP